MAYIKSAAMGVFAMYASYPACFYEDSDGITVVFPDLDDLSTCADTQAEAYEAAIDCLAGHIFFCKQQGIPVPPPSNLSDVDPMKLVDEGEEKPRAAFSSMVSVDVESYAKEHFLRSVKKTLTIPAWLNEAAQKKGVNFSRVLQKGLLAELGL